MSVLTKESGELCTETEEKRSLSPCARWHLFRQLLDKEGKGGRGREPRSKRDREKEEV